MSSIIAIIWTAAIVLAAPIAGLLARKPLATKKRSRMVIYAGSAANLIVIGAITAVIDITRGGDVLRAITWHTAAFAAWSIGISTLLILISIAFFALRRKFKRPPSEIVMSLLPDTAGEKAMFLLLCLLIGFVEEFLFRGFAYLTIIAFSSSAALAAAIVTISFALQHGIQDSVGILRAFVLLIGVVMTHSLVPAMIAHAVVDAFSGLYGRTAMASFRLN